MTATIKFASQELQRTERQKTFSEVWHGTQADIDAKYSALVIGGSYTGKGVLSSARKAPADKDWWTLTLSYSIDYDDGVESDPSTNTGPTSQRLSTINMRLPLNRHPNYRMKWNNFLIQRGTQALPAWWDTATSDLVSWSDMSVFRWVRSLNDMPPPQNGVYPWTVLAVPTMGETEEYDYETYQIVEFGRHTSKTAAGWAAATKMNCIFAEPMLGDFGITAITGGNWKLDDVQIYFDGKYWIAQRTYTLSGDPLGWSTELYEAAEE